ncbi:MAG: hypothetical protein A3B30_02950 [Candidatus Komeilibacteria bacterium RIFCSPLOWO2_01_FULL_52_15]|uniref:Uncharacterized protein n=2 Tax=Candidatus Komeiliibacteriota TaxID=1817908 RepID=A0A1G2BR96_9BACT|nr:MAG: hypothetical protein A2677_02265 [Candidatus Komeilibacteria bacterium RIFCSPHIGHO2_01_FULL_52_14]OGY91643.1 MAG: hypothetical protein A3B30_02950 [Candidatus Komeilibacteria bacterium RIFCSPLOWO2_01_FULL_52_15]
MPLKDPLSSINPQTVGYGKSGHGAYKKDDQFSRDEGVEDVTRKFMAHANRTLETANLSRENVEIIMGHLGEIVGKKVDRYSELNRDDREHFRHRLEQERQHGKLSDADIKDAWKIWDNFKR